MRFVCDCSLFGDYKLVYFWNFGYYNLICLIIYSLVENMI